MSTPLNRRAKDVFLSHSSSDKLVFVDTLYQWLSKAGLAVWYDRNLSSQPVAKALGEAIDSCKAAVIVLSRQAVRSRWVEEEINLLLEEQARNGLRIATVRLDEVEPPGLLRSRKYIDVREGQFSARDAALLMDSLFGGRDAADGKPVYLSRGWRPAELEAASRIMSALQMSGLRLVCDWTDQPTNDAARVRGIIQGTGGLVAILPHRGKGETSPYIIREIGMARDAGLPVLAFVHHEVKLQPEWALADVLAFDGSIEDRKDHEVAETFGNAIERFMDSWRTPPRGEHIFLGHSLEQSIDDKFSTAQGMLARMVGLPVKVGSLVTAQDVQGEIVRLIRDAALCIIDITNLTYPNLPAKMDFALNSCIEAGIALGCDKPLYLTCRGPRRSPPFMFRNKQVWFYEDDLELIGFLRQIAWNHRRMVL